ncbi:MAG TPA: PSD1 and planctomycete cytochrome C domain-containing protein [Pirellulaceae bacterium]|nr:PSD1 and planctomycete cytochrome C domain-containing protein [Pirellulaceae bacterium]
MKRRTYRLTVVSILTVCAVGIVASTATRRLDAQQPSARRVDFASEIQPLLAQRCFACHGAAKQESGLALHRQDRATARLESRAFAIQPGQPDRSEILVRVSSSDPNTRMPPRGEPLKPAEVELLRRWIAEGAEWAPHWSYRPLVAPRIPDNPIHEANRERQPAGVRGPVDRFIGEQLISRGLSGSTAADPRTLLRRVSFDLTGLPPTPEALDEFVADAGPDAFERVVDRLLASPRLGERWARHWLDLVHFAETHGQDQDRPRPNAWPYRDYVVRSFNADRPYGMFVEQQVAGDVLWPVDPEAIRATGMLAAGPWDESSLRDIREDSIDREVGRYLDRDDILATVLNTFSSTTIHCARCHDHKFDPVSQADYYNLQAVFAATDKAERAFDPDPEVARRRRELTDRLARLPTQLMKVDPELLSPELRAEVETWERQVADAARQWNVLKPAEFKTEHGSKLTPQDDGSLLAGGDRPERETYTITAHSELAEITGLRLEVLSDPSLPKQGPGRQDNGNLHLNELIVTAAPRDNPTLSRRLVLRNPRADFDQQGWTITHALDSNPSTAWGIYPEVGKSHRAVFELAEPLRISAGVTLTFELRQTHGGGHLIGRPRFSATGAPLPLSLDAQSLPAAVAAAIAVKPEVRTEAQRAELAAYILSQRLQRELAALPPQELAYVGTNQFKADGSFRPSEKPREVRLLHRGDIRQPRDVARPAALNCLPSLPSELAIERIDDEGQRRAALARWLSDPRNGLTWRSISNRLWQYHFGKGLVDSPNDFGAMGGAPSHPALLDWLAVELQRRGGSLKALHRGLVTSGTYRQSSTHRSQPAEIDADNRLLWRMNRSRLDAESIRDAVGQIAGTLDLRMGGPSVKQFIQSPGVHVTPVVDYQNFNIDDPANYRRSIYRFVFRTVPDPFMEALDCPDASQLTPARNVSVTALQALAMLNDKYIVRQCEHLAIRLQRESPDRRPADLARQLFEQILLRRPDAAESSAIDAYISRHGLANTARWLLNTNEFIFVD